MKICNNWEYSIKFECSTVTVNFWKQLCRVKTSNRPVQAPKHPDVQSPGAKNSSIQTSKQTSKVKASKCPESKHPGIQIRHIQSPSVQSPGSRPCVQSPASLVCQIQWPRNAKNFGEKSKFQNLKLNCNR